MSIGNNIKLKREQKGLNQNELAEMIGVSDKTVSSWEINRTEPKMGMIEKVVKALGCKKTDIIGADEPTTIAAHLDTDDLTEDELDDVNNYIELVKKRRNRKEETL